MQECIVEVFATTSNGHVSGKPKGLLIRCRDCVSYIPGEPYGYCDYTGLGIKAEDYCSASEEKQNWVNQVETKANVENEKSQSSSEQKDLMLEEDSSSVEPTETQTL